MVDSTLIGLIENELREDLNRYDDEYDVWVEVVMDCPPTSLEELFEQIPEDQLDDYFQNYIYPYIRSLGESESE